MLTVSFCTAVFASLCWLIYMGFYLGARLDGVGIGALGLTDLFLYAAAAALPVFVIWSVWGYFYRFIESRRQQKQFQLLWQQQQQTAEYFEMIGRVLLQTEQNRKDDFVVGKIDLFIAEMNELLSDLMERYSLASADKIKILWSSVKNGNRWGFAKAVIELKNTIEDFEAKILDMAEEDALLAGIVKEFCARYVKLTEMLKKHDSEKIFLEIIETGALGRVFAIFAPVADSLNNPQAEKGVVAEMPLTVCSTDELAPVAEETEEDDLPELILPVEDEVLPPETEEAVSEPEDITLDDTAGFEDLPDDEPEDEAERITEQESVDDDILRILGATPEDDKEAEEEKPAPKKAKKTKPGRPVFKLPKLSEIFKWQQEEDPDDWIRPQGDIDPLTLALERSFGRLADNEPQQPMHTITAADASKVSEPVSDGKFAFANTDKTLKNLQKEWEEMKKEKAAEPEEEIIDLREELEEIQIAVPEEKAASNNDEK